MKLTIRLALPLILSLLAVPTARAQQHMEDHAWIHRGDEAGTMVHPLGDADCWIDFPADCLGGGGGMHDGGHGGMAGPDSLFCQIETIDPQQHTGSVVEGIHCRIDEPDGTSTLDGWCMRSGLLRRDVQLTVHYDPQRVDAMGLTASDLCLAALTDTGWQRCADATHDELAHSFSLATSQPAAIYAVVPTASTALGSEPSGWGELKAHYDVR